MTTGSFNGENKAGSSYWTPGDLDVSYGGPSDLWGTSFTPVQINNSDFGAYISAKSSGISIANIDHIGIKVYYTNDHSWTAGVDQSDAYQFKISSSTVLGTNDHLSIGLDGDASFSGKVRGQDASSDDEFITKGQLAGGSLASQWATSGTDIYNTNTGKVGIGTTNPTYKFEVADSDILVNEVRIGRGPGNNSNTVFGAPAT